MAGGMLNNLANLRQMRYGNQSAELAQIQSARQALRLLDVEITKAEVRLRALPAMVPSSSSGSGGGGSLSQEQRLINRRLPRLMRGNKIELGPVEMGRSGLGLNAGYLRGLGGRAVTGMIGFHVAAGLLNQGMDLVDRNRKLIASGATPNEARDQLGLSALSGIANTVTALSGARPLAGALLRAGGMTQEDAEAMIARGMENVFSTAATKARRDQQVANAIAIAGANTRRQYADDYEYVDKWTPEDFDVQGDIGRSQLRAEVREKNRAYLKALADVRMDSGIKQAEMDARGS